MTRYVRRTFASSLIATIVLAAPGLYAASITWNAIQTATGNASDVVTTGTFFDSATSYAAADVTLNGVTFRRNLNSDDFSGSLITFTNRASGPTTFGAPPGTWDANYQTLGTWGIYQTTAAGGVNINLGGLTIGKDYLVQLWLPYWDQNWTTKFTAGNSTGFLNHGVNPSVVSQYVVGQFTADAASQTINAIGPGTTVPNDYGIPGFLQLRILNPEPLGRLMSVDFSTARRASVTTATADGFKADINAAGQNLTDDKIGILSNQTTTTNYWNYIDTSATNGSLVDSLGNNWNITVTTSGLGGSASDWNNPSYNTPDNDLATDGLYAPFGNTNAITTTIGNLDPTKLYDLVVYHADDYVSEIVSVNGVSPVPYSGSYANAGYSDASLGLNGSDFWYFHNLSPNGSGQLIISSSGGGAVSGISAYNTIVGFQLVQVPEPGSLTLMAYALVGFMRFAWRKETR